MDPEFQKLALKLDGRVIDFGEHVSPELLAEFNDYYLDPSVRRLDQLLLEAPEDAGKTLEQKLRVMNDPGSEDGGVYSDTFNQAADFFLQSISTLGACQFQTKEQAEQALLGICHSLNFTKKNAEIESYIEGSKYILGLVLSLDAAIESGGNEVLQEVYRDYRGHIFCNTLIECQSNYTMANQVKGNQFSQDMEDFVLSFGGANPQLATSSSYLHGKLCDFIDCDQGALGRFMSERAEALLSEETGGNSMGLFEAWAREGLEDKIKRQNRKRVFQVAKIVAKHPKFLASLDQPMQVVESPCQFLQASFVSLCNDRDILDYADDFIRGTLDLNPDSVCVLCDQFEIEKYIDSILSSRNKIDQKNIEDGVVGFLKAKNLDMRLSDRLGLTFENLGPDEKEDLRRIEAVLVKLRKAIKDSGREVRLQGECDFDTQDYLGIGFSGENTQYSNLEVNVELTSLDPDNYPLAYNHIRPQAILRSAAIELYRLRGEVDKITPVRYTQELYDYFKAAGVRDPFQSIVYSSTVLAPDTRVCYFAKGRDDNDQDVFAGTPEDAGVEDVVKTS